MISARGEANYRYQIRATANFDEFSQLRDKFIA
jgi:hypothetical protein